MLISSSAKTSVTYFLAVLRCFLHDHGYIRALNRCRRFYTATKHGRCGDQARHVDEVVGTLRDRRVRPVVIIGSTRVVAVEAVSSAAQRAMAPFSPR